MINTAIEVALEAHKNQFRKGTNIPYITHPLAVGIILAKAGFSDEVIAARYPSRYRRRYSGDVE